MVYSYDWNNIKPIAHYCCDHVESTKHSVAPYVFIIVFISTTLVLAVAIIGFLLVILRDRIPPVVRARNEDKLDYFEDFLNKAVRRFDNKKHGVK